MCFVSHLSALRHVVPVRHEAPRITRRLSEGTIVEGCGGVNKGWAAGGPVICGAPSGEVNEGV